MVTFITIIICGKQVAVVVKGDLLRVAQAAMNDLEMGPIREASEDGAGPGA